MTFSLKRKAIRARNAIYLQMREAINHACDEHGLQGIERVSLTVPRQQFELAECAMHWLKAWREDEQRDIRVNGLFVRSNEPRTHFIIKGCPVFCGEPE